MHRRGGAGALSHELKLGSHTEQLRPLIPSFLAFCFFRKELPQLRYPEHCKDHNNQTRRRNHVLPLRAQSAVYLHLLVMVTYLIYNIALARLPPSIVFLAACLWPRCVQIPSPQTDLSF